MSSNCNLLPASVHGAHPCKANVCPLHCADTEGSFMVERVVEIADACIRHLKKLANNGSAAQKDAVRPQSDPCLDLQL